MIKSLEKFTLSDRVHNLASKNILFLVTREAPHFEAALVSLSVVLVLVIAGVRQQVAARVPRDGEGRRVHRDLSNLGGRLYVADVDPHVLRCRGQQCTVMTEADRPDWPLQA